MREGMILCCVLYTHTQTPKGHKETFGGDGYVCYCHCGDSFMRIYVECTNPYRLNMCNLTEISLKPSKKYLKFKM